MKPQKGQKKRSNFSGLPNMYNNAFRSHKVEKSKQKVARRAGRYKGMEYRNATGVYTRLPQAAAAADNISHSGSETSSASLLRSERLLRNGFINENMMRSEAPMVEAPQRDLAFFPEQDPVDSENETLPDYSFFHGNDSDSSCSRNSLIEGASNIPLHRETDIYDTDNSPAKNEFEVSLKYDEEASQGSSILPQTLQAFSYPASGCMVILVNHEETLSLSGKVLVSVLSGCIEIFGYIMKSDVEETVPVYSSDTSGRIQIHTKCAIWKDSDHCRSITSALKKYIHSENFNADEILNECQEDTVVLLLRKHNLTYAIDMACNYIRDALPPSDLTVKFPRNIGFTVSIDDTSGAMMINEDLIDAAEVVQTVIQDSTKDQSNGTVILVIGKRGLGKSTSIRYITNVLLSSLRKLYYLDMDPGQSEFTPPGCVSLTEVTKPLLGPPFTHTRTPVKIAFYGNVSIQETDRFCECITNVVSVYKKNFQSHPLIINTFGWLKGLGMKCINHLKDLLPPSIQIELIEDVSEEIGFTPRLYPGDIEYYLEDARIKNQPLQMQIRGFRTNKEVRNKQLSALSRRNLSILSYFGRCQPYFSTPQLMNGLKPYCVRAEDVAFHTIHNVYSTYTLHAFLNSFIALCVVKESEILMCTNDENAHKHLKPDADFSQCVGFGFIRAIDLEKNLLYVLTPEPASIMKDVNTFVKGNISMPAEIFQKQEIYSAQMPYVKQLIRKKTELSKNLKRQF